MGVSMATIGYARVSSKDQNLDRQTDALQALKVDKLFTDKLSGKDTKRVGLGAMLDFVREGDTVYIASFDRLARSLSDLLKLVEMFKAKGVRLVSIKESVDTATPHGKLQLALFGGIAEFEREIIAQRRDEGISSARERGKRFGRPRISKPEGFDKAVKRWKQGKATAVETFTALGLSKSVFYSMIREEGKGKARP
jgi:DNA invertase Pin-like site-specific DNA recombinase